MAPVQSVITDTVLTICFQDGDYMPHFTKRYIEKITPQTKEVFRWDKNYKGFGVRVSPKGRKSFIVQYRKNTRTKRVSLGTFGNLTVNEARKKAKRILGEVAAGHDPAEKIKLFRDTPTMATACERFLKEHVATRLKPSTQKEYKRNIELYILPKFRTFKVNEISQDDIAKAHHELSDKPYQANRNLGVLSRLFNLCEIWGYRPEGTNPCRHIKKYKEKKRETFLSKVEITNLMQVLDTSIETQTESIFVASAFKLLLLTGCRLSEIQTLQWSYIKQTHIEFPESKTDYKRIPLSPLALSILDDIPKLQNNPFVIAGKLPGRHYSDLQKPWRRIRKRANIPHVRIHDLRHTFASHAVMSGHPLPIVAKLLGHTQIQTTMRYAHLADKEVAFASENISSTLLSGYDHAT